MNSSCGGVTVQPTHSSSTLKVENYRILSVVCQFPANYDIIGVQKNRWLRLERGIPMNYEKIIVNILDSFGVNRSYTGHGYVVYGLLLIIEDPERLEFITKSLYLDIAKHYRTNWSCVEKNIRTIANCVWDSRNTELLETIFNKSNRDKKPTNKEFLKCMYDYLMYSCKDQPAGDRLISVICPISNQHCEALSTFYIRLSRMLE